MLDRLTKSSVALGRDWAASAGTAGGAAAGCPGILAPNGKRGMRGWVCLHGRKVHSFASPLYAEFNLVGAWVG